VLDAELDAMHDRRLKSIFKEVLNKMVNGWLCF
jgi:hypothetical protein